MKRTQQAEELTPEQMLADMRLHARSSVVHVEPTTVAEWRECIGHALCGAAFDAGLVQAAHGRLLECLRTSIEDERGVCSRVVEREAAGADGPVRAALLEAAVAIRMRGAK